MIGLAALVFLVPQEAPPTLTLDDALAIAAKSAFSIRLSESKAQKARNLEKAAKGLFGPMIGISSNYSHFDGVVNTSGLGGSGGGSTSSFSGDSKSVGASLSGTIDISGTIRKNVEALEYARMAAEAGVGVDMNTLKLLVRNAFDNVLLADSLVGVQKEALKASQDRLDKANVRFQAGAIPKFDVLRFQNEVQKAEQALVQAEGTAETAKQALNNALARPIETPFQAAPINELPAVPDDPSNLVVAAIRSRPEVKQTQFTITSLDRLADAQNGSLRPSLVVQANYNKYIDPSPGQSTQSSTAAVTLQVPVFDSGITKAKVDSARKDEEQAQIGFEQLLLGIALEVRNAHTQALTAKKAYDVALDSQSLAQEALRLAQIRYDEGAGILLDVTSAQADLTAAQGNVQNAKYQYLNAYAALLKALGRDDLNIQDTK